MTVRAHASVLTTAPCLFPTGTSINPLLRAAYLSRAGYNVTLLLPWLELEDQKTLFPPGMRSGPLMTSEDL